MARQQRVVRHEGGGERRLTLGRRLHAAEHDELAGHGAPHQLRRDDAVVDGHALRPQREGEGEELTPIDHPATVRQQRAGHARLPSPDALDHTRQEGVYRAPVQGARPTHHRQQLLLDAGRLHLQHQQRPPGDLAQHFAQRRDPFALARVEAVRLAQAERRDLALAVRRAIDRRVVEEHRRAIAGAAHVDLDGVGAQGESGADAGQRVLRSVASAGGVGGDQRWHGGSVWAMHLAGDPMVAPTSPSPRTTSRARAA